MENCLLLALSNNHLHAQRMANNTIVEQRDFLDSTAGHGDFLDFIKHQSCPAYLLTDLVEEDFRLETIPYLTGKNQHALLQRKFDQLYRGTPFQQATLLQRQETGRRDAEMLFSALTHPNLIKPWLDSLLTNKIPLAGIYSVAQISAPLVQDHPSNHLLLITWNKFAGLRETYFNSHHLQISRLTPRHDELSFSDTVLEELGRTYQYLKSLSLLPSEEKLDVRIVGSRNDLMELQTRLPTNPDMHYDFVDLSVLEKQLHITPPSQDSNAQQIFLYQLANHQPKNQYGNTTHTHFFSLWKLRHRLWWASGILITASVLWTLQNTFLRNTPSHDAINAIKQQTLSVQNETQQVLQSLPKSNVSSTDIKAAVTLLHNLKQRDASPQEFLMPLSLVMDQHPEIQLDELAWKTDIGDSPSTNATEYSAQLITLKGHLDNADDYRATLTTLNQFQRALEEKFYRVTALKHPLDLSPQGSLSNPYDANFPARDFVFQLRWRAVP